MINTLFYNTLLTGGIISALILVVFLISPALNKRYHAVWRFNIWKVFMMFLIVPVGFILRLLMNSEKIQNSVTTIKHSVAAVATDSTQTANFQMIAEKQQSSIWIKLVDMGPQWVPIIWSVGVCVVTIYLISVYIFFIRNIRKNSEPVRNDYIDKTQAEILSKRKGKKFLQVYQCNKFPSPMIVGIFKPVIFIPKRDYTVEDLQIILTHELTHYLRHDLLYKGLFIVALILHWYNPFVHIMTKAASKDMELCCDQDAIKGKNKEFRSDYSDVIMGEIINRNQFKGALFACMGSDKKTMEERLRSIFNSKKRKGGIIFLGALAIMVAFSGFAYTNDHDVPDFNSSEYQQLLEKAISDKAASRKARLAEKNIPYKDIDNIEELVARVMDEEGNYDIYEVYALVGMEPPAQVLPDFDLSQFDSHFTAVNNCIQPHILGNGDRAIYSSDSGKPWKLKKGQIVKLNIYADINRLAPSEVESVSGREIAAKGNLIFGYMKDDECIDIKPFNIDNEKQIQFEVDGEKKIEFEIQEDGKYKFYLFCPGSLDIIIKWISIDIE
ncbi:MAG: M56 family metallopeptidase [Aminipila sp.]